MPTNDTPAPPPRPSRRTLGRGPGTAPPGTGPDRSTEPSLPQDASQSPAPPPAEDAAEEPQNGAQTAPEAPAEPSEAPAPPVALVASAVPVAPEERGTREVVVEPEAPAAPEAVAEPEPVHARADLDAAPPAGGHGGEAAGAASGEADASSRADASGGGGQGEAPAQDGGNRFTVRLDNFEGPFDLLLQLISKHKLDVTEVALSKVTDEFMAHIRAMGPDWDLDQTTEFLVVAATLLDLKAARLLPAAEVEDEADLALLEARDLLFARLLQYRAYKQIADIFNDRLTAEAARHPRTVGLEPHHAELLPDVVISIGPEGFAKLAVKAMQPKPKPQVYVDHIHAPLVSVREQAEVVVARLRELGEATFAALTEDAPDVLTVVARFLALLELYRERAILLDQPEALGSLMVRWTGEAGERPLVTDEFDQEAKPRKEPEKETATSEKEKEEVAS
ncbi:segregation and condensation protein A [Streptomyces rapamycinicus]|uniref:Segregation and condensation protein A n=2 Tax=Streptomyces rapamycinicus TaxID=1226757 RepID=A0A3L8RE03_STRRN|nr:ScpA family protein [Streptomyces rapamycinicus]MBB4786615.1 segregation and condensation protein A [Streptomyces rapamycinicus]RLV77926.1 chromosome segregation and condensation protein ScpA [Streptomyces rapamycinicus NRRL 5491]UTO66687.1 segregation/condensation protein A [Streptomyces rapamycinicus]UTP34641.1 segregation/condensation protein A [Streptomyces rapamycinicus NRRL 5491]